MPPNTLTTRYPYPHYWWIAVASVLLSIWLIWMDPVINRDAIIYLRAADAYLTDGLAASQKIYSRPILPILMASVHQLTGIPLLHAGLLLITIFYVVLCIAFVSIVRTLGGDRTVQLIAAVVILSHPWLNHTRSSIMREPAFLAFLLLSFRELLFYVRQPGYVSGLRWLGYILTASVFRFEGLFFACLAPLAILCCREVKNRYWLCAQLLLPALLCLVLAGSVFAAYVAATGENAATFPGISLYLARLQAFPSEFSALAEASAETMLEFTARGDASFAVTFALLSLLVLNVCRALSWPWVIAAIWGVSQRIAQRLQSTDRTLLLFHIGIGIAYLVVFVLTNRFMLERYSMQVVIFILLFLPFVLARLWHSQKWKKYLVIVLLAGMTLDTVHTNDREKMFLVDATDWVRANTPSEASIVSNEKYIAYFSRRSFDWPAIQGNRFAMSRILETPRLWRDRDYLVMYIKPREEESWQDFLSDRDLSEQKTFGGGRKGRVAVVQVPEEYRRKRPRKAGRIGP